LPTIPTDVANERYALETEEDAANAFLNLFEKENEDAPTKKPSEKGKESNAPAKEDDAKAEDAEEETATEETEGETEDAEKPSEDAEETEGETEETTEDDEKKYAESDDIFVKVKVGDEEHEVPVKDLKRLFGQEAALTRKSQEVAAKTKEVEASQAKNIAALDVLVKRAQEAANPYRQINWAGLMKDPAVSPQEVSALQEAARAAFENETFLTTQLDNFMGEVTKQQQATHVQAARDCVKALTTEDSPTYIKGWNESMYNDIRSFAVEQGLNQQMVNQLTDPAAFKMMHMALQFHRGAQKVVTTKVNKAPKKIVKSNTVTGTSNRQTARQVDRNQAVAKLRKSGGRMDDAVSAFETMFKGDM
jgi:hypothetical protein